MGSEKLDQLANKNGDIYVGTSGEFTISHNDMKGLLDYVFSGNRTEEIWYTGTPKIWRQKQKVAVIFGITGMDGSHLADLLLEKGYKVVGVKRRSSTNNEWRVKHLSDNANFSMVSGDLTDYGSLVKVFTDIGNVDEVYNLAAQSHVGESFKQPGATWDITGKGCMNILQCLVDLKMTETRFYQASSSEMFGSACTVKYLPHIGAVMRPDLDPKIIQIDTSKPKASDIFISERHLIDKVYQDEDTKHLPQSPYAIAKCAAHMAVRLYREAYGIHASAGILFNHEGPRRGENFVTKKITKWIAEFKVWLEEQDCKECELDFTEDYIVAPTCRRLSKLRLGNLEAKRDWGHAKDYVRAMHLMLQQDKPDDYVICTEETRSVKDFLDVAFGHVGVVDWSNYVVIDPAFYRPAEVDFLLGDCSKAREKLKWQREYSFDDLVKEMVNYDIDQANEKV